MVSGAYSFHAGLQEHIGNGAIAPVVPVVPRHIHLHGPVRRSHQRIVKVRSVTPHQHTVQRGHPHGELGECYVEGQFPFERSGAGLGRLLLPPFQRALLRTQTSSFASLWVDGYIELFSDTFFGCEFHSTD